MADVPVYSVFAFCKDETGGEYRRLAPLWRLEDTVRHAAHRGFDTILVELVSESGDRVEAEVAWHDSFA